MPQCLVPTSLGIVMVSFKYTINFHASTWLKHAAVLSSLLVLLLSFPSLFFFFLVDANVVKGFDV